MSDAAKGEPASLHVEVPRKLAGRRFDHVLAELVPMRSRSQLQKLVRKGRVKLDGGKVVRSNFNVRGGERLLVHLSDPNARVEPALALEYVHVDEDVAVVDKPAGMLMHPTERLAGGTVSELALARFGELPVVEDADRPGIVHRLDRETSGLLLLALTDQAMKRLRNQFRARTVEKRYRAIVYGVPARDEFAVDQPLGPVPELKDHQRVDPRGREASTSFRVLETHGRFAELACHPRTGRRHQIRVHLAHVGHPIVGDKLYRPDEGRVAGVGRHLLHAEALAFDHPRTGERMRFASARPSAFDEFTTTARAGEA